MDRRRVTLAFHSVYSGLLARRVVEHAVRADTQWRERSPTLSGISNLAHAYTGRTIQIGACRGAWARAVLHAAACAIPTRHTSTIVNKR